MERDGEKCVLKIWTLTVPVAEKKKYIYNNLYHNKIDPFSFKKYHVYIADTTALCRFLRIRTYKSNQKSILL